MIMLSPGVKTRELDFSAYIPQISTTIWAIAGTATKGPVEKATLITSIAQLTEVFGPASDGSYGLIAGAQFLSKGNQLYFTRAVGTGTVKASAKAKDNSGTPADIVDFSAKDPGSWYNGKVVVNISNIDAPNKTFDVKVIVDGVDKTIYEGVSLLASSGSSYIESIMSGDKYVDVDDLGNGTATTVPTAQDVTLTGGADGAAVTKVEISAALNKAYTNTDSLMINLISAPGYAEASVVNTLLTIAENRGDTLALIDTPFGLKPQEAMDWHNGKLTGTDYPTAALNSSYGALYWSWLKVNNGFTGKDIWTPPSGNIAAVYANNDNVAEEWFAPAGHRRGHMSLPLDVEYTPDGGERDALYSNGSAINPIVNFAQQGITVWGQRTLQRKPSATDRVGVRRMLLSARRAVALSSQYVVFEQNDEFTWNEWKSMIEPYFESIKARRGLYDFKVIMDRTTVTDDAIDRGEMPGQILLKPTKAAEFMPLDFTLMSTGASFGG